MFVVNVFVKWVWRLTSREISVSVTTTPVTDHQYQGSCVGGEESVNVGSAFALQGGEALTVSVN